MYEAVKRLITAMSILHEQHDHHGPNTAGLARLLAEAHGIHGHRLELIETGAHLHDVGKLLCDKEILNAPRKLTPAEMLKIQEHAILGWVVVDQAGFEPEICEIVRSHHERYDGAGYPDGIYGHNIPIAARIVRITDCYSALTASRSYREAYSPAFARAYIQSGKGQEFDPKLVDLFFEIKGPWKEGSHG